jgi:hypothetical protein
MFLPELNLNKEVAIAAVSQNGEAISSVSRDLKDDEDVVLASIANNPIAIMYSPRLKHDRKFVMEQVEQDGNAIQYASLELRNDPELLWIAKQNGLKPYGNEVPIIQSHQATRRKELGPFLMAAKPTYRAESASVARTEPHALKGLNKHGHHFAEQFKQKIAAFHGEPPGKTRGGKRRTRRTRRTRRR